MKFHLGIILDNQDQVKVDVGIGAQTNPEEVYDTLYTAFMKISSNNGFVLSKVATASIEVLSNSAVEIES